MSYSDPNKPPSVPEGWLAKFDDRYKTWYYVNLKTKKSQWEAPEGTKFDDDKESEDVPPPAYSPHDPTKTASSSAQKPQKSAGSHHAGRAAPQGYGQGYGQLQVPPAQQYTPQQPYGSMNPGMAGGYGGAMPYGQAPYGGAPYGGPPYGGAPYGQMPYAQQTTQRPSRFGGLGGMGGMGMGLAGGLLGGYMLNEAIDHQEQEAYADGYQDGYDGGYDGGGFDDGGFDGGF